MSFGNCCTGQDNQGGQEFYFLRAVFLGRGGNRLESGAPASLAHFIGIDEIIGRLSALLAFQWHGPRNAAHVQPARAGLPLDPLDEFHGHVAVMIRIRLFRRKEKRPGTKQ